METGDKRDARGRRRATPERRAQLVGGFVGSGLTMAAFARREGINYATFAGWVLKAQRATTKSPIKFAEVRLPLSTGPQAATAEQLEVRLADGAVVRGGRVADVVALVRALRS